MIKKLLFFMCTVLAAAIIYCMPASANAQDLTDTQKSVFNINKPAPQAYNKVDFETVTYDKIPKDLAQEIDSCKTSEGFLYYKDKGTGYLYIAVMRGKEPTGGYSIKVDDLKDAHGMTNVTVEEKNPGSSDIVPQVVMYPYVVIKAKLSDFSLSVKNSSGKVYDYLGQNENKIIGCSWGIGNLENIYAQNDYTFLKVRYEDGEDELYYVKNDDKLQDKIKNLKIGSTVSIKFVLGTPQKYDEMFAFPLSEIEPSMDKSLFTDKKWEDLNSECSLDILRDKEWTISYNSEINQNNVNDSDIYVADSSGNIVPVAVSLQKDRKSIKVIPYKPYKLGQKYYMFISAKLSSNDSSFNGYRMCFKISDSVYIK